MSRGLNKVLIIGHLGGDPEMRYTPSGRPVTSFSVAMIGESRLWLSRTEPQPRFWMHIGEHMERVLG